MLLWNRNKINTFQISFVIDFDTMDIKILDEHGRDLFDRPLEEMPVLESWN